MFVTGCLPVQRSRVRSDFQENNGHNGTYNANGNIEEK
jgi:hypothetical protein